ncbi:hypothetical protein Ancab_029872 [Ancistrocladus abbreviatus]
MDMKSLACLLFFFLSFLLLSKPISSKAFTASTVTYSKQFQGLNQTRGVYVDGERRGDEKEDLLIHSRKAENEANKINFNSRKGSRGWSGGRGAAAAAANRGASARKRENHSHASSLSPSSFIHIIFPCIILILIVFFSSISF